MRCHVQGRCVFPQSRGVTCSRRCLATTRACCFPILSCMLVTISPSVAGLVYNVATVNIDAVTFVATKLISLSDSC